MTEEKWVQFSVLTHFLKAHVQPRATKRLMCPTSSKAPESEVPRNVCGTKPCFSESPVSICEIRTTAKQHFFRSSSHIGIRSTELKDSTGCVGYYTNRQEKKRPRKIHFGPKAVRVFKRNSPSVSAVAVSLTHAAVLGKFQKSKNLSGCTSMGKRIITSKGIATYLSFQK